MFLILDITTHAGWPKACPSGHPDGVEGTKRIPAQDRPTVLQCGTREQAEAEVVRLLKISPKRTYALFEHVASAVTMHVPWAVTVGGDVVSEVRVPKWVTP